MDEQDVRRIVQEEIKKSQQTAQYGVTRVPIHTHNGIDSPNIAAASVIGVKVLPGARGSGGVADPEVLNTQVINNIPDTTASYNPPKITFIPTPIIYGFGVGVHSAFEGGTAPLGAMVFFENTATLSALWIQVEDDGTGSGDTWYKIQVDP